MPRVDVVARWLAWRLVEPIHTICQMIRLLNVALRLHPLTRGAYTPSAAGSWDVTLAVLNSIAPGLLLVFFGVSVKRKFRSLQDIVGSKPSLLPGKDA